MCSAFRGAAPSGSGAGFEQLQSDVWYVVSSDIDGFLTASTCNGGAEWDTKIAVYNYDASTFDPASLPDLYLACNEDCGDEFFASSIQWEATASSSYLVRVGGYDAASFGPGVLTLTSASLPVFVCASKKFQVYRRNWASNVPKSLTCCAAYYLMPLLGSK